MVAPDEGEGAEAPSSRLVRCICCGVTLVEIDVSRAAAHLLLAWQLLMLALFALWCEYDYALGAPMDLTYTWYSNLALFALVPVHFTGTATTPADVWRLATEFGVTKVAVRSGLPACTHHLCVCGQRERVSRE